MAIQQKLSPEQQAAYEAFKSAVQSLRAVSDSLHQVENEIGIEIQVIDLLDMFASEDDSVDAFLGLVDEVKKEG